MIVGFTQQHAVRFRRGQRERGVTPVAQTATTNAVSVLDLDTQRQTAEDMGDGHGL